MTFSLFYLLIFPESDNTSWDQIELFHAGKKVKICGPLESKWYLPPGNFVSLELANIDTVHFECKSKVDKILRSEHTGITDGCLFLIYKISIGKVTFALMVKIILWLRKMNSRFGNQNDPDYDDFDLSVHTDYMYKAKKENKFLIGWPSSFVPREIRLNRTLNVVGPIDWRGT
ncbi:hypothetical protein PHYBLDRAFT_164482 [Phycomyces blakesleeanus NRRL 1555(-)]|uniref:Uncharacterized protein n=1 Tax=Phycomyces blakesleeanus (strain ATCC 8743b / DSM 1359 / FGSC 10004 / NBRC 33097 / NRRL 1555) TaxID=763407 RepID=A0A167PAL0_PHYB8|nr:hypothetical protein PHYBLDRAFT_164482 [Phycomyces blakesleeanus NRRL 1555(-)]OAD77577.1 hypothetical protein PHYBLDRAFT_164482 [Phycomyces blakesleeanus NRRL 1555(-)]|eukprot:XP_018295617.1 hypothetical protein PHYBLDRAFT_164482 [Phycomyces blakesleeanus NRRL 1555(-)]